MIIGDTKISAIEATVSVDRRLRLDLEKQWNSRLRIWSQLATLYKRKSSTNGNLKFLSVSTLAVSLRQFGSTIFHDFHSTRRKEGWLRLHHPVGWKTINRLRQQDLCSWLFSLHLTDPFTECFLLMFFKLPIQDSKQVENPEFNSPTVIERGFRGTPGIFLSVFKQSFETFDEDVLIRVARVSDVHCVSLEIEIEAYC